MKLVTGFFALLVLATGPVAVRAGEAASSQSSPHGTIRLSDAPKPPVIVGGPEAGRPSARPGKPHGSIQAFVHFSPKSGRWMIGGRWTQQQPFWVQVPIAPFTAFCIAVAFEPDAIPAPAPPQIVGP